MPGSTAVAGFVAVAPATLHPAGVHQLGRLLAGAGQPPADQLGVEPRATDHALHAVDGGKCLGQRAVQGVVPGDVVGHREVVELVEVRHRVLHGGRTALAAAPDRPPLGPAGLAAPSGLPRGCRRRRRGHRAVRRRGPAAGWAHSRRPRYGIGPVGYGPPRAGTRTGGRRVATVEECEAAMHKLAERLKSPDGAEARGKMIDRSISCHLRDLDVTFARPAARGEILDIRRRGPTPDGQLKLATTSDDLVALVDGQLNFAKAWAPAGSRSTPASST